MKHSIAIPDWIWDYESQRTGTRNPASSLRDRLAQIIAAEKAVLVEKAIEEIDFDAVTDDDTPTHITVTRPGVCHICKGLIQTGDGAFYYTVRRDSGRHVKVIAHPECWDK